MNNNINKRVALYIRVSTEDQVQNGNGLEIQKDALLKYVGYNPQYILNTKNIYSDEGKSGAYKEDRPALQRLYEDAAKQEFDVVLVWKIDRFFRKTLYLLEGIEALDKLGIGFISITQQFDTTHAFGKMMLGVMGVIAELERDLIRERTQNGIIASMRKGKWGRGKPPYGFNKDENGFLIENTEERKIVELIFSMLVDNKLTLNAIGQKLTELKIPTYTENGKGTEKDKKKLKFAHLWQRKVLFKIVTNEMYIGKLIQNRYTQDKTTKKRIIKPGTDWIISECPRYISDEVFQNARNQLDNNKVFSNRNTKEGETYMLSTLLHCGDTGYKYVGYKSGKGTKNYRLNVNKSKVGYVINQRSISAKEIERAVWDKISSVIKKPELIRKELEKIVNSDNDKTIKAKLVLIQDSINKAKSNNKGLLGLINDFAEQGEIAEKIKENYEIIAKLEHEKLELGNQLLSEEQKETQLKDLESLSKNLSTFIDDLSYESKTFICRKLIEKIVLEGDNVKITLLVPISDNGLINSPREARLDIVKNFFDEEKSFIGTSESVCSYGGLSSLKNNTSGTAGSIVNLCYHIGGTIRSRTGLQGFAGLCMTDLPWRQNIGWEYYR